MGYIFTRTYIRKGNKQGMPFVHPELSGFLRGGSSQSAKYNKKSGKPYQDIDTYFDFGRPIHILPHMFRHTYISILASHGLPLDSIRELVGHSEDSKEIEKIYLHITKRTKEEIKHTILELENEMY